MIKRSQALHILSTRGTLLSDNNGELKCNLFNVNKHGIIFCFSLILALCLGNALLTSYIYTLKLEHCGLSGRPILCLGKFIFSFLDHLMV